MPAMDRNFRKTEHILHMQASITELEGHHFTQICQIQSISVTFYLSFFFFTQHFFLKVLISAHTSFSLCMYLHVNCHSEFLCNVALSQSTSRIFTITPRIDGGGALRYIVVNMC